MGGYADTSSLRAFVEERSEAVSIAEATTWALVHGFATTQKRVAELHAQVGGPIVGRSRIVTPSVADELEELLEEDEPDDDEDDDGDEDDQED